MALLTAEITGKTLASRYEVQKLDHEELLGAVYTAKDLDSGELVSVKVLHPHLTEDREKFKRFGREITATYMVSQQNTVEVTDWGEDGELHYLVMEFLKGHTLEKELEKGPMPWERVVRIGVQIARAVGAAHQEGIVHRALGPSNILLLENAVEGDFVKVLDFGLSKLEKVEDDEETGLTTQNTRVGNAEYMAPEYIKTSKYHTKGDLYSLGALMYHMLVGKPPFTGPMLDVLSAHLSEEPVPPSQKVEGVPGWLDKLVLDLLGKTPEERPGAYRVVQQMETSFGGPLDPPDLYALDASGAVVIPEGPPKVALFLGVALLVILLGALVVVGLIVAFALIAAVSLA
ncbi:MAG: serine/threonine protein kinase [Alphaproteobacteria bacterium]|nr:serine/threonine protein kinase [Alphaproteobacteria bacterium]